MSEWDFTRSSRRRLSNDCSVCAIISLMSLCREALKKYSARQLRLMYIMHAWEKPMAYGSQALEAARAKERDFKNFFQNVSVALREYPASTTQGLWGVS